MILKIHDDLISAALKAGSKNIYFKEKVEGYSTWHNLDSKFIEDKDQEILLKLLEKGPSRKSKHTNVEAAAREDKQMITAYRVLLRKIKTLSKLSSGDICNVKIRNLDTVAEAIKKYFKTVPRHWFFHEHYNDDMAVPFVMIDCTYHPPKTSRGSYEPACVVIEGQGFCRGEQVNRSFDFEGKDTSFHPTIGLLFVHLGLTPATDELIAEYEAEMEVYKKLTDKTGEQYTATGIAKPVNVDNDNDSDNDKRSARYYKNDTEMEKNDERSKVVIDDYYFLTGKDSQVIENALFSSTISHDERDETVIPDDDDDDDFDDNEDEEDDTKPKSNKPKVQKEVAPTGTLLPMHPRLVAFDLKKHQYFEMHVSNLVPYEYDERLGDKLVLPVDKKSLIDVLLASAQVVQQDIVKGKTGGTIILCSGAPGTGKTLTAEVYGEVAHRPLYVVQCSQLGTNSNSLERHLQHVLDRAIRWNAVLLIDEADVYIHERGTDLEQNAIVGVFLRLLEYYSGVMFLTTNRATVVDDAIASRMMAHVRYTTPKTDAERLRIWDVLSVQYKVPLTDTLMKDLIKEYPEISGRSIKQLLKLAKVLTDSKTRKLDLDLFKWLCQFQDTEAKGVKTE